MSRGNDVLNDFVEESLLQAPALVTHQELEEYKARAKKLLEQSNREARLKAEAETRYEIHKKAPVCLHSFTDDDDHKTWCGFVNKIWVDWARENNARIVNGEAELQHPEGSSDE